MYVYECEDVDAIDLYEYDVKEREVMFSHEPTSVMCWRKESALSKMRMPSNSSKAHILLTTECKSDCMCYCSFLVFLEPWVERVWRWHHASLLVEIRSPLFECSCVEGEGEYAYKSCSMVSGSSLQRHVGTVAVSGLKASFCVQIVLLKVWIVVSIFWMAAR